MPVLPFITDSEADIKEMVLRGKESGAKFIYPSFGMTVYWVIRIHVLKEFGI